MTRGSSWFELQMKRWEIALVGNSINSWVLWLHRGASRKFSSKLKPRKATALRKSENFLLAPLTVFKFWFVFSVSAQIEILTKPEVFNHTFEFNSKGILQGTTDWNFLWILKANWLGVLSWLSNLKIFWIWDLFFEKKKSLDFCFFL